MKLTTSALKEIEKSEVRPGNVYPAMGGRKNPGTSYWLVIATSETGAHCIGFDKTGSPCGATTYLKGAMRERPVLGRINVDAIQLDLVTDAANLEKLGGDAKNTGD